MKEKCHGEKQQYGRSPNDINGTDGRVVVVLRQRLVAFLRFFILLQGGETVEPFTIGEHGLEMVLMVVLGAPIPWVMGSWILANYGIWGFIVGMIVYSEVVAQLVHAYAVLPWLHH